MVHYARGELGPPVCPQRRMFVSWHFPMIRAKMHNLVAVLDVPKSPDSGTRVINRLNPRFT